MASVGSRSLSALTSAPAVGVLRLLWLAAPFTIGASLADALADTDRSVQVTVSVGTWVLWGLVLLASLVPRAATLTPVRIGMPGAAVVAGWAAIDEGVDGTTVASLAVAALLVVLSLTPQIGEYFVDGSSYGAERRVTLRPPGPLLAGPIPVAWLGVVVGVAAGPVMLANRQWIPGVALTVVGYPLAYLLARALHRLALRWLVFVPGGLVVHDLLALDAPVLFERSTIVSFGPAPADSSALDLTMAAPGLALELTVDRPQKLGPRPRRGGSAELVEATAVLVTPTRPGHTLHLAADHRLTS